MRINRFSCKRFGGLKDKDIEFKDGLNIILGPNEAGKSTIVNGIYHTIFKDSKLRMNYGDDREFKKSFMPHPDGDYINGSIEIYLDDKEYRINKEWCDDNKSMLQLPDGNLINSEKKVRKKIEAIMKLGKGTYDSVVFAKQKDIKRALKKIIEDAEIQESISSILRKTVMELDGISIEKLGRKIDGELDDLLKKWDYEKACPMNNRDINHPYKVGLGSILEAYYEMKRKELDISHAQKIEEEFEQISKSLKELEKTIEFKKREKKELSILEDDIFKRASLEPKLESLNKEIESLKEINKKFPKKEEQLKVKKQRLRELEEKMERLEVEYKKSKKLIEKKRIVKVIDGIEDKKRKIKLKEQERDKLPLVTHNHIKELEKLKRIIDTNKAKIEAGTLICDIRQLDNVDIWLTKGLEERRKIDSIDDISFKADGYLKIEVEDILGMEIRSGEINFEQLSKEYNDAEAEFKTMLKQLNVQSIEEAKLMRQQIDELNNDVKYLKRQMDNDLGQNNYEELKERLKNLEDIGNTRDMEEISEEINNCTGEIKTCEAQINSISEMLKEWTEKYGDFDELFDVIIEVKTDIKSIKKELQGLKPLPDRFESTDEFKRYLTNLRNELERLNSKYGDYKDEFYRLENELPQTSCEEMKEEYDYLQSKFDKLMNRAQNLMKIKENFKKTVESMDKNTFEPLVKAFSKYLSRLTRGKYAIGSIDDEFHIKVKTEEEQEMPIYLLSTGTYDGVALALRFAILESIYDASGGFLVLDDCLVDLDPERKKEASDIIKEFSKNNQIIFTTCDPQTAELLNGHIIEL